MRLAPKGPSSVGVGVSARLATALESLVQAHSNNTAPDQAALKDSNYMSEDVVLRQIANLEHQLHHTQENISKLEAGAH